MKANLTAFERRIEMLFFLTKCKKTTVTELAFYTVCLSYDKYERHDLVSNTSER